MAQIVTITNPLTGQPVQVDQLDHTAQEIDDAIARSISGGAIDIALQNKADSSSVYTKEESISASTRTALSLSETATPDAALAEIAQQLSDRMTLLWENASPTSDFSAQTISVNTDGCLGIIVSFAGSAADFGSITGSDIVNMTIGTYQTAIWQNSAKVLFRTAKWESTSKIKFDDAIILQDYNNPNTRVAINTEAIPYRIYGIKV